MRNFFKGVGSIFNIMPKSNYRPITVLKFHYISDEDAIRSDWEAVGMDISNAMNKFKEEHGINKTHGSSSEVKKK